MSISSKIYLDKQKDGYLAVTLECDLVHMDDASFEFVMAIVGHLRRFEKERKSPAQSSNPTPAGRQNLDDP